ncbi:hypothetical protein GYMLUDRAFT_39753 [Collybiopsis luxurians FD-317 M1]|nr:hypothetical protein GYMLUDRAFT_39753 [Collybiopsis luxurians FD-317 M1]
MSPIFLRHRRNPGARTGLGTFVLDSSLPTSDAEATPAMVPPSLQNPMELLERLGALSLDRTIVNNKRYRRLITEICTIYESALAEDEKTIETAESDGVTVHIFLPVTTNIVRSIIQCIEARGPASNSGSSGLRFRKKVDPLKELKSLRNQLGAIHFIAMPYVSPQVSCRGENALVVAAHVGGVLTALCDGVPILGMLKPVAELINGVCTTIQTLRSNDELVAEILRVVRDDFRMVVRKIERYPAAQADAELRKDVNEYFCTLQDIICHSLGKINGTRNRGKLNHLRLVTFAQKDRDNLQVLRYQVQEARNAFQTRIALSTAISISTVIQQAIFHNPVEQSPTRDLEDSPTFFQAVESGMPVCTSEGRKDALPFDLSRVRLSIATQPPEDGFSEASNLYIKSCSSLTIYGRLFFFFKQ